MQKVYSEALGKDVLYKSPLFLIKTGGNIQNHVKHDNEFNMRFAYFLNKFTNNSTLIMRNLLTKFNSSKIRGYWKVDKKDYMDEVAKKELQGNLIQFPFREKLDVNLLPPNNDTIIIKEYNAALDEGFYNKLKHFMNLVGEPFNPHTVEDIVHEMSKAGYSMLNIYTPDTLMEINPGYISYICFKK